MEAQAQPKPAVMDLSPSVSDMSKDELETLLDQLSERFYSGEFNDADLVSAEAVVNEMERRGMEMPSESFGVTL